MSDTDKCWHYSCNESEDGRLYCYKCYEFVTRSLQWRGTIKVGRFEASFDQVTESLDLTKLIEDFTNHNIKIENVIAAVERGSYPNDLFQVIYTVKGDTNIATLVFRCDKNYTGTGEFYKKEEEQKEPVEA